MRILAIDTTGPAASAAVYCNGQVHQAYLEDGHTHSQKIQALIEQAMQEAGLLPNMLTGIAVTNGPGSFTGIRIGVSMAKAMAQALSLPLLGVSTLQVLMRQANRAPLHCAVMDARRKEVYGAAQCGEKTIVAENAMPLQDFLHIIQEAGESACFAGDAVRIYEKEIIDALGERAILLPEPERIQQAGTAALIAADTPKEHWKDAFALNPNYLRISQAERERLAREKQNEAKKA